MKKKGGDWERASHANSRRRGLPGCPARSQSQGCAACAAREPGHCSAAPGRTEAACQERKRRSEKSGHKHWPHMPLEHDAPVHHIASFPPKKVCEAKAKTTFLRANVFVLRSSSAPNGSADTTERLAHRPLSQHHSHTPSTTGRVLLLPCSLSRPPSAGDHAPAAARRRRRRDTDGGCVTLGDQGPGAVRRRHDNGTCAAPRGRGPRTRW
jgi:hypothetical protein